MSDPSKYTVGWISAITTEIVAAQQFLDERHDDPEHTPQHDNNVYTLGKIGRHNVVMASLPKGEYGTTTAATVARDMLHSFPNIRIGLMVGIAGGAPSAKHDVRLGDIVVSSRDGAQGGVFQYDFGKTIQGKAFQHTQFLNQPPTLIRAAVGGLEAQYEADGHDLRAQVAQILDRKPRLRKKYSRPPEASDKLYRPDRRHRDASQSCSEICGEDPADLMSRPERGEDEDDPAIHYGLIASANTLMKDAHIRDKLAEETGVLCFEMEAAGLMNHFPCLVIRGVCDYADSHKNKEWQGYAAMVSAAYARDLLLKIHPNKVEAERPITETLDHIGRRIDETTIAVQDVRSTQHSEKIHHWLSPPDPSVNANHARDLRCRKTGMWLLEHTMFRSWMSGSPQHLWLHGLAGCGKTVLSTTVLDAVAEADDRLVLNFFFDFSDTTKQTLDGMLRSLASQLYQSMAPCTAQLDALFRANGGGGHRGGTNQSGLRQPTTKALSEAVSNMLRDNARVCIVLDALDESTTRSELLNWLKDVASTPELCHVQLFCTGRPEPEFLVRIPSAIGSESHISLDKAGVNADIREYVAAELADRPDFQDKQLSQDIVEQIKARVGDGADGMFRWAACQLDSLAGCPSPRAIKDTLQRLPRNLSETYERMIGTIPEDLLPAAMRLLQFLVQAPRRLTVPEAIDVIATDTTTDPGGFDEDSRVFRDNEVLRFCPSLLSIVEVSESQSRGSQLWGVTRKELHLAHFSVKEFLMLRADFQQPACGVVITMTCLAYLGGIKGHYRQLDEEAFWGETFDRDSLNRDYPMARLAAEIWTTHAAWAQSHDSVFQATLAFLEDHDMFQRWGRLYQADHPSARNLGPPRGSLLYYACLAGLTRVAHELVDRGAEVNVRAGHFGTPLQAACYGGHGGIVQLLIERGADVSAVEGYLGTALQAASFGGHINVAKLLLEKGVDVNVQTGMYGNALQAASWQGHADIVKLLLQEGADVNAVGGLYGTALQAASDGGHTEVVGLLLKEGANVSARVYRCGNALYAASQGGHADIVKILLEFGADVSKGTDGVWGDPLAVALQQGRVDIVRLLIRAGAQIENDPFYAGLVGHSEDSVRLLLEKARADVDAGNRSFRSETVYYDPHVYHYAPPSASWDGIDRLPPGQSVEMDDL